MPKTLAQRFEAALTAIGSKRVPSRSGKYVQMTNPQRKDSFFWIGSAGALRRGRTSTGSVPVGDREKAILLEQTARPVVADSEIDQIIKDLI